MEPLQLAVDPAWAAGLLLSVTRVAAFVVASPLLARAVAVPARMALALALGTFLASPVETPLTLAGLLGAATVNAATGFALGWLTGLVVHLFPVAGGLVDVVSGLAVAQVFDPTRGEQGSLFNRAFALTGATLFLVVGGLELVVRGLALSVEVIALDGALAPTPALADLALRRTTGLMVAGLELALPVVSALFLVEVVLGIASRFAPQANVFLLGLPVKLFVALSTASLALLLFPEAVGGALDVAGEAFRDTLAGLRGRP